MTLLLTLLTKIPFVDKLLGMCAGKGRLWIEYLLIAAVVTIGGFTVAQWYSKVQLEKRLGETELALSQVGSRLGLVEMVNQSQEETINSLHDLRIKDSRAITGLLQDFDNLSLRDARVRRELNELRNSNQAAREYIERPIPPELARMLEAQRKARDGTAGSDKDRTTEAP